MNKYETLPPTTDWRALYRVDDVRPSPPDGRDFPALARSEAPVAVPAEFELSERPIRNQGGKGACTTFGFARILETGFAQSGRADGLDLSEDFMYARLREQRNWLCQDSGSVPRDCAEISVSEGWLTEAERPYNDRDLCTGTTHQRQLADHAGSEYRRARTWAEVQQLIYQFRVPVVVCFTVYTNFFQIGADGIMPIPSGNPAGGHLMVVEGWRIKGARLHVKIPNSWSAGFGDRGYVWAPVELLDGTVPADRGGAWPDEFWTVLVAGAQPAPPVPDPPQPDPNPQPNPGPTFDQGKQAAIAVIDTRIALYRSLAAQEPARRDHWNRGALINQQTRAAVEAIQPPTGGGVACVHIKAEGGGIGICDDCARGLPA